MTEVLLITMIIIGIVSIVILIIILKKVSMADANTLLPRLDGFEKSQEHIERAIREEVAMSREELGKANMAQRQELTEAFRVFGDSVSQRMNDVSNVQRMQLETFSGRLGVFSKESLERLDSVRIESANNSKQQREEIVSILKTLSDTVTKLMNELASIQKNQFDAFSAQLTNFTKDSGERMDSIRLESATGAKQLREEVVITLNRISETNTKTMSEMASIFKDKLESVTVSISKLTESNEKKLEDVRVTVEGKLQSIQIDNSKQLDMMRQTVDEKLQGTLEKRLGDSFKQVSDRLELVHKGLGEMQTLASGVGDLKKVLTNVKTRGTWGEVQLGALLEQVLNPDQFGTNVATKDGGERVEFAVKLPGQGLNRDETIWLPIDAKFPIEDYQRLIEAQEKSDVEGTEAAAKQLENRVKACAKDISDKYLNPPRTTDFGILFLPIEGLFAEVIRRIGLTEVIQRDYRIVIAGPTTLWSLMSSLQMGFRTLAIQKRSSEVWNLLAAVKTEWTKYGEILDNVQKKLTQASDAINKASQRSRAVGRKLRDVQELPTTEAALLLPQSSMNNDDETIEEEL